MAAWQIAGLPAWDIAGSREPADALIADALCKRIDGIYASQQP